MTGFWITLLAETDPEYLREHPIRTPEENKPQPRLNAESERAPYWIPPSYKEHTTAPQKRPMSSN